MENPKLKNVINDTYVMGGRTNQTQRRKDQ